MDYEEGDLVLCKVIEIVKTTVFVETLDGLKGSIVFSEVAPGRIRNIRAHVVPNKIIVCKILSARNDHLFLSLRRVKDKEKKELLEEYKKEKTWGNILKKIIENSGIIIEKIKEEFSLLEFFENAKKDAKLLKKYFNKEQIEKISKILLEKKEKQKEIKKEFKLSCESSNGIKIIKSILSPYKNIFYLGNSKFVVKITSTNLKQAGAEMNNILETIEKEAKKNKCGFEAKK